MRLVQVIVMPNAGSRASMAISFTYLTLAGRTFLLLLKPPTLERTIADIADQIAANHSTILAIYEGTSPWHLLPAFDHPSDPRALHG